MIQSFGLLEVTKTLVHIIVNYILEEEKRGPEKGIYPLPMVGVMEYVNGSDAKRSRLGLEA